MENTTDVYDTDSNLSEVGGHDWGSLVKNIIMVTTLKSWNKCAFVERLKTNYDRCSP